MNKNSQILIKERSDHGVLRLTMNDLVSKNSLSEEMMNDLIAELKSASKDKSIKAIVLAANGNCLLYTSPSPRDATLSRMPSSA